jgi:hypothetical protein
MPAVALRRTLFSVTDRRALLSVGEAWAGPRAIAPGSTKVSAASGLPARPYQDGRDLTFTEIDVPILVIGAMTTRSCPTPRRANGCPA